MSKWLIAALPVARLMVPAVVAAATGVVVSAGLLRADLAECLVLLGRVLVGGP